MVDIVIDLRFVYFDMVQIVSVIVDFLLDYVELVVFIGFFLEGELIEIGDVIVEDQGGNWFSVVEGQFGFYQLVFDRVYNIGILVDFIECIIQGVFFGVVILYLDMFEGVYFFKVQCQKVCYQEIDIFLFVDQCWEVWVYFYNDKLNCVGCVEGGFWGYISVMD